MPFRWKPWTNHFLQCAPAAADHDHDSLALPPLLEPPARVSTSAAVDIDADVGPVSSSLLLLLLLLLLKPFLTPMLATQRCLRSPARRPDYLFTRDRYDIQFASATPLCLLGYVCDGLSNIARNRDSVSTSALLLCCFLFYFARSAAMARNQNQTTKATISRPACLPVSTARLATFVSQCLACTIAFAKRRLRLLFNLASHLHAVSHEFVFAKYNNNNAFSTNNLLAERRFSLRLRSNTRPSWRRSSRTRQGKCTGENECACVCACFRVFFCGHIFRLLQDAERALSDSGLELDDSIVKRAMDIIAVQFPGAVNGLQDPLLAAVHAAHGSGGFQFGNNGRVAQIHHCARQQHWIFSCEVPQQHGQPQGHVGVAVFDSLRHSTALSNSTIVRICSLLHTDGIQSLILYKSSSAPLKFSKAPRSAATIALHG